jgi:hypothetical protein
MASHSYQLAVDIKDQLTIAQAVCNYQLMVDTQDMKAGFVARLNKALDGITGVRSGRGRNVDLYEGIRSNPQAKASTQATHKWLSGESMPSRSNMLAIAEWLKVRAEWLAYGEGPMELKALSSTAEENQQKPLDRNKAPGFNMAALQRLKGKATPRSLAALDRIEKAAQQGRLKEADLVLLEGIAARFEELNTKHP